MASVVIGQERAPSPLSQAVRGLLGEGYEVVEQFLPNTYHRGLHVIWEGAAVTFDLDFKEWGAEEIVGIVKSAELTPNLDYPGSCPRCGGLNGFHQLGCRG